MINAFSLYFLSRFSLAKSAYYVPFYCSSPVPLLLAKAVYSLRKTRALDANFLHRTYRVASKIVIDYENLVKTLTRILSGYKVLGGCQNPCFMASPAAHPLFSLLGRGDIPGQQLIVFRSWVSFVVYICTDVDHNNAKDNE